MYLWMKRVSVLKIIKKVVLIQVATPIIEDFDLRWGHTKYHKRGRIYVNDITGRPSVSKHHWHSLCV